MQAWLKIAILLFALLQVSHGKVWVVTSGDIASFETALASANASDIIQVTGSFTLITSLNISNDYSVVGNGAILQCSDGQKGKTTAMVVMAKNATISGFIIQNCYIGIAVTPQYNTNTNNNNTNIGALDTISVISNVTFTLNSIGLNISGGSPIVRGSSINKNFVGVYSISTLNPTFTSCDISNNAYSTPAISYAVASGLHVQNSNVTIINCTINNNIKENNNKIVNSNTFNAAGGFYLTGGAALVIDTSINGNIAQYGGGGVMLYNTTSAIFTGCTINNNTGDNGGLTVYMANISMYNVHVTGNHAWGIGGGIFSTTAVLELDSCILSNNTAADTNTLGLIGGGGINAEYTTLSITNSLFHNNTGSGGGLALQYGHGNITNSTFTNNNGTDTGGGIMLVYSYPIIENCTIKNNFAASGGGIYTDYSNPIISNTKISGNIGYQGGGLYMDESYYSDTIPPSSITFTEFSDNSAYGWGGGVYLFIASPVITNCTITRNFIVNVTYGVFYVDTEGYGAGIFIQDAAEPIISYTEISSNYINAPPDSTVGDGGGIYAIYGGMSLDNVKIFNNSAPNNGGGIFILNTQASSSINISNTQIYNNSAASGGGIYQNGNLNLTVSSIYGNVANYGGGISAYIYSTKFVTTRCNIYDNLAYISGGGLYLNGYTYISHSNISNNSAWMSGGGVYVTNTTAQVQLINGSITSNTAPIATGIFFNSSTGFVVQTTLLDNHNNVSSELFCCNGTFISNIDNMICNYPYCPIVPTSTSTTTSHSTTATTSTLSTSTSPSTSHSTTSTTSAASIYHASTSSATHSSTSSTHSSTSSATSSPSSSTSPTTSTTTTSPNSSGERSSVLISLLPFTLFFILFIVV